MRHITRDTITDAVTRSFERLSSLIDMLQTGAGSTERSALRPFHAVNDFTPLSLMTSAPLVLVVNPALPVKAVKDLVALAKAKPLTYGSAGNWSGGHLSGELLKQLAGIDATHVPYKGAGPARTPPAIVQRLHKEIVAALRTPDVRDKLVALGSDIVGNTPEEFRQFIVNYIAKWAKVVKAAGIKLD